MVPEHRRSLRIYRSRSHRRRFDDRNLQTEGLDLLRQRFVERFDSPFRSGIEADEGQRCNSKAAGDTENVSAALFPQQRQSRSENSDHAEVVRVEDVADLLIACFLYRREQARTGIVDKDVQPAEVRVGLMNCLLYLRGVGDVEGKGQHSVAKTFREIGYVCQFAGGRCNPVAALKSSFGPDAAEAARGAGDEPCLLHFDSSLIVGLGSGLGIAHVPEISKKRGAGGVPSELCTGLRTGGQRVSPREEPEEAEMFLGLFLRNGNDGHIQATADSGGDVFERHTLFGDGVVTGSRCAFLQGKPVEAGDIRNMRGGPAVLTIADVRRDSLRACYRNQGGDEALLYGVVDLRQAHHGLRGLRAPSVRQPSPLIHEEGMGKKAADRPRWRRGPEPLRLRS